MKNTRIYLAAMAVAMLFVASCQKEETVSQDFSASMEVAASGGKTYLDGTQLKWVYTTDQVSITSVSGTSYATSTFTAVQHPSYTSNQSFAKLNLNNGQQELAEGTGVTYRAIYPASIAGNNGTTVTIPAVQASTSGELTGYPMYAESSSKTLQFKNLCSVVKIGLKGTERVSKIEVVTDQYLNGTFTIGGSASAPTLTRLTTATDHKKVTTLTMSSPVQLNSSTYQYFYIYLPVQTYKYIKVNAYNASEQIFTKSASITNGVALERSKYHPLEFGSITFVPNALSGEFSVSSTRKVSFSKGNLLLVSHDESTSGSISNRHYTSTDVYKFADNQYDKNEGTSPTYDKWLYQWGITESASSMFERWKNYSDDTHTHTGSIQGNTTGTTWRCLTKAQWTYLLSHDGRINFYDQNGELLDNNTRRIYALGTVNGIHGLLIFPDVFYWPLDEKFITFGTQNNWGGATNSYTIAQWKILESAGCVFLPVTGRRNQYNQIVYTDRGQYWSSTKYESFDAYYVNINGSNLTSHFEENTCDKTLYQAIRLVKYNN